MKELCEVDELYYNALYNIQLLVIAATEGCYIESTAYLMAAELLLEKAKEKMSDKEEESIEGMERQT